MKKYLMSGIAAIAVCAAFTSCSKSSDLYDQGTNNQPKQQTAEQKVIDSYQKAFENAFGKPAANQDWGLAKYGSIPKAGTRVNAGKDYPSTSTGINANANEWADPNKEFGGWLVPDPLTEGQKLRVQKYFQANPNLDYKDPEWRHFFVQQVYKGATDPGENSTEVVIAADGSKYTSSNMNHLTVGLNEQHINNFNAGDCSTTSVLNNGQKVGGSSHNDQIMLMVNIDDTSCFGYHDSGSSNQSNANPNHNDKMALVSAAIIDAWAAANGNPGEAVVDKWNRSFMGFDLAIKEGDQAYERDNNGNVIYATYGQAAESPRFAWDGEKIIEIAEQSQATGWQVVYKEGYETIQNLGWLTTNKNFYVAADQVNMSQTISMNRAQASTITGIQNAPVLKDIMVGDTYYQSVINLPRINQLVEEGYLPVNNKSLTEWVKVGKSDGYFSDWIVTLTKAERNIVYMGRIMGEDLTAEKDNDFDFNDVVFDWAISADKKTAYIKLYAAGGTLPLKIGTAVGEGQEVHALFGVSTSTMVNTGVGADGVTKQPVEFTITKTDGTFESAADIIVSVDKTSKGASGYMQMTSKIGEAPCLLFIPLNTKWVDEYENIEKAYTWFGNFVEGNNDQWTSAPVDKFVDLILSNNK